MYLEEFDNLVTDDETCMLTCILFYSQNKSVSIESKYQKIKKVLILLQEKQTIKNFLNGIFVVNKAPWCDVCAKGQGSHN